MSGHSKWSKVKHQKATSDALKSQLFTKASRAITMAVREGGGITDPEKNFRLRLAMEKARQVNMPKETINRAIKAADTGGALEQVIYEGYGPGGVALLAETATDNRKRAVAAIKHLLERAGGSLASPGAVSFLFERSGVITVPKSVDENILWQSAIEAGAQDIVEKSDVFEIYTTPTTLSTVKQELINRGLTIDNDTLVMRPQTTVTVSAEISKKAEDLIHELEGLDDVQNVYTNLA